MPRRASAIVLVVLLLAVSSVMIFAGQSMALGAYRESVARYRSAGAWLAARGGVHYAVASMAAYAQPAQILPPGNPTPPDFYRQFKGGETTDGAGSRAGWFVATTPYPPDKPAASGPDPWGIKSEQARIPLGSIPSSAEVTGDLYQAALGQTVGQAVSTYVTQHQTAGATEQQGLLFRHPYEILAINGVERVHLFGNDQNEDHLHHTDGDTSFEGAGSVSGFGPLDPAIPELDRGLSDRVTTFTDGRIDLYNLFSLDPDLATAYLSAAFDQSLVSTVKAQAASTRAPYVALEVSNTPWQVFARKFLVTVPTFFRVTVWGTYDGVPLAGVTLVTEYMVEDVPANNWFRIAHWRED